MARKPKRSAGSAQRHKRAAGTARRQGTVGIIGLGIMGGAFARLLVKAGWRVIGFDISAARRKELGGAGVEIASNAESVVAAASVIIVSLPSPAALDKTVEAIVDAKVSRRIVVEAGTFSLDDKLRAAEKLTAAGHVPLDCPVSGTGAQAATGDIVIYASGDPKAITRLKPMFAGFSRALYDLGEYGNGSRMKYVANLLVAIHNVASAEAMVLGMKAGLDPQVVHDLVVAGAGTSRVFELRAPMMVRNRYGDATMRISTWQKDMAVIGDFAAHAGVPTPLFSATLPLYAAAMSTGHGTHDTAAVCAVLEQMAGVERGKIRKAGRKSKR